MGQEYIKTPCEALKAVVADSGLPMRAISAKMHISTPAVANLMFNKTGNIQSEALVSLAEAAKCRVYIENENGDRYLLTPVGKYQNRVRKYPTRNLGKDVRSDVMNIQDDD